MARHAGRLRGDGLRAGLLPPAAAGGPGAAGPGGAAEGSESGRGEPRAGAARVGVGTGVAAVAERSGLRARGAAEAPAVR